MTTFDLTKADKLKRMLVLRIMNALGMIAWREEYGEAEQKLRLIHPLTCAWVVSMAIYGVLSQGIPDTIDDLGYFLNHDTVWF